MKTVKVEDWHIKTGLQRSCYKCPIANAITPLLPVGQIANLDEGRIYVMREGQIVRRFEMPAAVKEFVTTFDDEGAEKVKPFEFEIDL